MIRASQQAAYGLGYLASLTHNDQRSIDKRYDVDYSAQAREDFAWYASMSEAQLQSALRSMPVRRRRGSLCRDEVLQLWRGDVRLTYAEIAQRVGCHPDYVYKVVKGARA